MAKLIARSNAVFENSGIDGFFPYDPQILASAVIKTLPYIRPEMKSLDMGAGTGGWWLLAACAGIPSYAIEIDSLLVESSEQLYNECVEKKLIDPTVPCHIACGDMIPEKWQEAYGLFKREYPEVSKRMPSHGEDSYSLLQTDLSGFALLYCWSWPTQSRFLFNLFANVMSEETIFVLPSYVRYTQGEHMNASMKESNALFLETLEKEADIVIGRKVRSIAKNASP